MAEIDSFHREKEVKEEEQLSAACTEDEQLRKQKD